MPTPLIAALQAAVFADSPRALEFLEERTGFEPACPERLRVSTAVAYRSPHLSMEEGVGFEPTGPEDPRVFQTRTRCRPGRPFRIILLPPFAHPWRWCFGGASTFSHGRR